MQGGAAGHTFPEVPVRQHLTGMAKGGHFLVTQTKGPHLGAKIRLIRGNVKTHGNGNLEPVLIVAQTLCRAVHI